ncbi:transmembrane protein 119b [Syngnathus scovelli]|uniref:transmembrane protein 119b n=1 Tax=Syngnathus scovelli TaxID=161590 RepID=UPI00210F92A5|nr:transmembrane protein 119b [Syngnathus scovelli]
MKLLLYNLVEGSTDLEEPDDVTTSSAALDHQFAPPDLLSQVVDFLRDHMVLVLVVASLLLIALLAVCGAVFLTRRRKFHTYYPSSYPAKMYVDQQDKSGGARGFHEIPEKKTPAATHRESQLTDSNKQLQADITRVAKSLRTPTKTLEDGSRTETPDESPPGPVADQAGEAPEASPQGDGAEKPEEEFREPASGRNLRPPSLHLHNDSATLQLIAGEKTAF